MSIVIALHIFLIAVLFLCLYCDNTTCISDCCLQGEPGQQGEAGLPGMTGRQVAKLEQS